jgi:transposase
MSEDTLLPFEFPAVGRKNVVAAFDGGRLTSDGGEVRRLGVFENRPEILSKMVVRLAKTGRRLSFCYEAGPCGYGLRRPLTGSGHECVVVAPSLIPIKAGDRVKTDRRDATMLAKLYRVGELTALWVPDGAHEAMRDLIRARATSSMCWARRVSIWIPASP